MQKLEENLILLGLTPVECKAYYFILKNKRVDTKSLSEYLGITTMGVSKLVKRLKEKGFIRTFKDRSKNFLMPIDIKEVEDRFFKEEQQKREQQEVLFKEMKNAYGKYTVKVVRIPADELLKISKDLMKDSDVVYEFIDYRAYANLPPEVDKHYNSAFETIYISDDQKIPYGYQIKLEENDKTKTFAHILAYKDKVELITTNKESILVENSEIAEVFKLLIKLIKKSSAK